MFEIVWCQGTFSGFKSLYLGKTDPWLLYLAQKAKDIFDIYKLKAVGPNLSSSAAESAELREIVSTAMDY